MDSIDALILGIVEGITEFLPISSTGHLMITNSILGLGKSVPPEFLNAFTVAIQLGAILAVVVLYFQRFFKTFDFYFKLFVAFVPIGIIGLLLDKTIDKMLNSNGTGMLIIASTFLLGGIILLFVDNWFSETENGPDKEIKFGNAFIIGLFQAISVIPGVSRAAATIIGGLTQKLNRKSAVEFSFFLAVPTMFVATAYKLFRFYHDGGGFQGSEVRLLLVGNVVAFVVALVAVKTFIGYLSNHGFKIFGIYRILAGIAIFVLHFSGVL